MGAAKKAAKEVKKEMKGTLKKLKKEVKKAKKEAKKAGKEATKAGKVKKAGEEDGSMSYTRKADGQKKCPNCNKKGGSGGAGGSSSSNGGGSNGGGSKGGDELYNFFQRSGKRITNPDFGFHRSKMKNFKQGTYGTGEAVAASNDWTDFGSRRNLDDIGETGLSAEDSADGRQKVMEDMKKKMKNMKKESREKEKEIKKTAKKVEKKLEKKLEKLKKKLADQDIYAEDKNLGNLVVRRVEDPEKIKE